MEKEYGKGDLFTINGVAYRFIEHLEDAPLPYALTCIMDEDEGTSWIVPTFWLPLLDDETRPR